MGIGKRCCLATKRVGTYSPLGKLATVATAVTAPAAGHRELWLVDSEEARARGFSEADHQGSTANLMKNLVPHCAAHSHGHGEGEKKTFLEELMSQDSTHLLAEMFIHVCIHGTIELVFHYLHQLAHRLSKAKAKARRLERAAAQEGHATKKEQDSSSSSSSSSSGECSHNHNVSHK